MEHYLPILNTVMVIFQSALYLENCFNFKRDDDSLQQVNFALGKIIPGSCKICAHQIVIFEKKKLPKLSPRRMLFNYARIN